MSANKNPHRFTLYIFLLLFIGFIVFRGKTPSVVSPVPEKNQWEGIFSLFTKKKDPEELKKRISLEIGSMWNNYSIYVKSISTDFSLPINTSVIFTAASINKLPILATLYHLASKNEIDLNQVITLQEADIQDYGTGSIRYDPPGTTYSIKTLAKLMSQKSDNTAAYILGRQVIGFDKVQEYINSLGLTQTDMEKNETSNADMALLMEKMYTEKVTSPALTKEMLTFITETDIEDRIPGSLPKGTVVYHKTGNGVGFVHDVGIVTGPKQTYYIGILTSDIADEKKTVDTMANVSRLTFDFLQ